MMISSSCYFSIYSNSLPIDLFRRPFWWALKRRVNVDALVMEALVPGCYYYFDECYHRFDDVLIYCIGGFGDPLRLLVARVGTAAVIITLCGRLTALL